MEKLPKILITGEIKTEYLISASGKVVADQPGGNLLYAAAGASLWSEYQKDIGLISKIGVNYPKENFEKILDEGFNSEGIRVLDQKLEHRSFIAYTDLRTSHTKSPISYFSQTGDTFPVSLLGYKGDKYGSDKITLDEQIIFSEDDLPDDCSFSNAAHLCPLDLKSHRLFPEILRRAKITHISVDPGDRYMQPSLFNDIPNILQGLTAFLPSESELKKLFQGRTKDLWEMIVELGGMGCSFVVVKSGENGQNLYDAESKKKYHIPAFPSNIVDITGAGDVFCGGFIAGLEQYNDPLQAVLLGNIAASFAVEGSGAFYTNDVLEGLQLARLEKLKTFVREI